MPLSPANSTGWTQFIAVPPTYPTAEKWGGSKQCQSDSLNFTAVGQGTGTFFRLPAGKLRILLDECRVRCPVGTATSDLHIGYAAYVNEAGTTVVADDNAFADNLDVGGGAINQSWPLPATGYFDINSRNGVDIQVMFDTANSPGAGELWLQCTYVKAG